MGLVPNSRVDKVAFFQSKIAPWTANSVAIGSSAAAITALQTKLTAAQNALAAQVAAAATAETATFTADNAIDALAVAGADIISAIRTKGRTGGNIVYELAQIPPPATPSTKAKPGTPFDFTVELQPNGTLLIKWACTNPVGTVGTMYQVYRDIAAANDFKYLGGNGLKQFIDDTIPAGATRLTYQIQAVRSNSIGVFGEFNVNFGTNTGGVVTATITPVPARIAA